MTFSNKKATPMTANGYAMSLSTPPKKYIAPATARTARDAIATVRVVTAITLSDFAILSPFI